MSPNEGKEYQNTGSPQRPVSYTHLDVYKRQGLILCGVSLVFLGIGSLTQALLEFELSSFFGRRKMEREIDRLSDHYIICGAGRVGRSAARELKRRPVPFVIVEQNEEIGRAHV